MISLPEALRLEEWDVVTVQQASPLSGIMDSYEPWLGRLIQAVRAACPGAEILLHRTWAYDVGSEHPGFVHYGRNQEEMFRAICTATTAAAEKYGLRVIPAGDAVQRARLLPEFHIESGGLSLTRDGYHLSLDYGRYLAALVWYHSLTGRGTQEVCFAPEGASPMRIALLKRSACPPGAHAGSTRSD